jgi:hypothetical protein
LAAAVYILKHFFFREKYNLGRGGGGRINNLTLLKKKKGLRMREGEGGKGDSRRGKKSKIKRKIFFLITRGILCNSRGGGWRKREGWEKGRII